MRIALAGPGCGSGGRFRVFSLAIGAWQTKIPGDMRVLILAAGYATRLYPLTLNRAKPLLEVAGKPMIEWVLEKVLPISGISGVYVVTNSRFHADFEAWAKGFAAGRADVPPVEVVNDGSTSDADKLGAIGDMHLVVKSGDLYDDDLIVVAGDNLFSESLEAFGREVATSQSMVGLYDVGDLDEIRKYNNVEIDAEGVITHFEEKPEHPKSTLTAIALYYYSRSVLPLLDRYVADGENTDQPGRFVQWLYKRVPVRTHVIGGRWLDIGSKETLEQANEEFRHFAI